MNIGIAGLGLIGGSLALALRRAGHVVVGKNRSRAAAEYALAHGVVDSISDDLSQCDVVFVALPPAATIEYICTAPFSPRTVVADICGVKLPIERAVCARRPQLKYVGTHPMAGKEVSGVGNASAELFVGASMVLTSNAATDAQAYALIGRLTADMGFARIVECSAEVHDKKIAYTSQLAHIVSNCYVKDESLSGCLGFTGGSFQDMTRIAGVDENVWTDDFDAFEDLPEQTNVQGIEIAYSTYTQSDMQSLYCAMKEDGAAYYLEVEFLGGADEALSRFAALLFGDEA